MNRHAYFRQQEKNVLIHHGIKGQKWGVRRYQNEDGSLTPEGKERYLKNKEASWNKFLDEEEATYKIGDKSYSMVIEDSKGTKDTERIKNTVAEIWNEDTISELSKTISSEIAEQYKPSEFGYNENMSKDMWKKVIEKKLDIEGLHVYDEIQEPSDTLPWQKDDGEWVPAGVWFSFDGVPFMTDTDGTLSLTKKKITNVGSYYPD